MRNITYANVSDTPAASRTVRFVLTDGDGGTSNAATKVITVNAVNDVPTISDIADQTINEDTNTGALSFTIGDAETAAASLTVSGSSSNTTLVPNANIVFGGSGASRTVTVTPAANKNGTATITVNVSDGSLTGSDTFLLTVRSVNDEPAGANNTVATAEDVDHVFTAAQFGFTDPSDSPANLFDSVRITTLPTDGVLKLDGTTITAAGGFISKADIDAGKLVFHPDLNENGSPYATFTFQVKDDGGTAFTGLDLDQSANTMTVNVTGVNDAPVVDLNGGAAGIDYAATFTEDGGAIAAVASGALTVADIDNANIASATITLTNHPDGIDESLAVSGCAAGITVAAYNSTTGVLALSGSASKANYEACLRTLTYNNADQDPDTTARSITVVVNDGALNSATATSTITVVAANDAPVVDLNGGAAGIDYAATFTEDGGAIAAVASGALTVADIDNANIASATITLTNHPDGIDESLAVSGCAAGITVAAYNSTTGVLALSGSASKANYEACLRTLTYNNADQDPDTTARSITVVVNDGALNSATATSTITVVAANDAPVVDLNGGAAGIDYAATFTEDGGAIAAVASGALTVADIDNANIASATITLTNHPDGIDESLAVSGCAAGITVAAYNSTTGVLALSGSASKANYEACLRTLTYNNADQDPDTTARSITVVVNDGALNSATATSTITVVAANDAPVVDLNGGAAGIDYAATFTEDGGAIAAVASGALTVADIDNANIASATITLTNHPDGIDESLAVSGCAAGITVAAYNSTTGVLALSGSASKANYEACLRTLTYNNADQDPDTTARSITVVVNDGALNSATATSTITVVAVNDPPVAVDDARATDEDTSLTVVAPGVLGNDTDAENDPLTVGEVNGSVLDVDSEITLGSGALLTLNADGSFTYHPNGAFEGLHATESDTDTFTYKAFDGTDESTSAATVTITVTGVNDAPVAVDDTGTTDEDTNLSVAAPGVLGNDTDAEGDTLTVAEVNGVVADVGTEITLTSGAKVTLNADGSFTYKPNGAFESLDDGESDTDSFAYKANDGDADSNEATVVITINGVNDAPVAVNDTGTTDEDTNLSVAAPGVLGNDTDADLEPITVAKVEGATANVGTYVNLTDGGKVNVASDGSFTFDPDGDFEDLDTGETRTTSFTYQASDDDAESNLATVTITVTGVNDAPVAVDDTGTTDEDTNLSVAAPGVLGNDTDAEGDTLTVAEVNGVVADVGTEITLTSGAKVTLNADGSFTYKPNGAFESLDDGESDTDSFAYKANDGDADSNEATVVITINGVNDAPVAVNDTGTTDEDTNLSVAAPGVLGNDTDADLEPITVAKVEGATANVGTYVNLTDGGKVNVASDGSFTFDPDGDFEDLDTGETRTTSFTYRASDDDAESNLATVTITVTGVNDAPVAVDDTGTTDEDTNLSVAAPGVLGNDTDAEGDTLTVAEVNGVVADVGTEITLTSGAKVTLNADGSFTYKPNGAFESLDDGESDTDSFAYKANDGDADSNEATVVITINGVNDAPVAVNDTGTTDEDTNLSVAAPGVLGNDTDAEGDTLSVAEVNGAVASVGTEITLASGALLTLNADGSYTYKPNGQFESLDDGESDTDTFTYKANDGDLDSNLAIATITINGVNDAPVANDDIASTDEDTNLMVVAPGVLGNDTDADAETITVARVNGLTASVGTEITLGSGAKVTLNADGSYTYKPNGAFEGLDTGETATDSFTYKASDGTAESNAATVTITINGVNDAPVAVNDTGSTDEDTNLTVAAPGVLGNDTDADAETITVARVNGLTASVGTEITLGSGAKVTLNADGSYTYKPNGAFEGLDTGETATDSFTYKASDGTAESNAATVTITINGVNDAPVAVNDTGSTDEDTNLTVAAPGVLGNDTDVDIEPRSVFEVNGVVANVGVEISLASGAKVTLNANGSYTYKPNGAFEGLDTGETATDVFKYKGTDGTAASNEATVTITISGAERRPGRGERHRNHQRGHEPVGGSTGRARQRHGRRYRDHHRLPGERGDCQRRD